MLFLKINYAFQEFNKQKIIPSFETIYTNLKNLFF